jgi:hypothetical protein
MTAGLENSNSNMNTNSLRIVVRIDRQAALLAGRILGETAEIDVSPEGMAGEWPALIKALDLTTTPARVRGYPVTDATEAALRAVIAEAAAEATARETAQMAANEAAFAEWSADPIRRENRNDYGYVWEKWSVRHLSEAFRGRLPDDWQPRKDAAIARITPEIEAHNAPHLTAVEAAKAEQEAQRAKAEAERKAADAVALAARKAQRLESGIYTRKINDYNERREGKPWIAKVVLEAGKLSYEFGGDFSGGWGKGGELSIACAPGDVIAWGQKDLRRPDKSTHVILHMQPDGGMATIDRTQALHLLRAKAVA